jgi:hypothetical protein
MLGRTRSANKVEPAPKDPVLKYKWTGLTEDGPSTSLFLPDFSESKPENSPWNIRLAEVFVDDYTMNGLPSSDSKDISRYFLVYLRTLQSTRWKMTEIAASGKGTLFEEASKRNRIRKRKITVRLLSLLPVQQY